MQSNISMVSSGNPALEFIGKQIIGKQDNAVLPICCKIYAVKDVCDILNRINQQYPGGAIGNVQNINKKYLQYQLLADLCRMGFINLFDNRKNPVTLFESGNIKFKYVSVSQQGIKLISATYHNRKFVFSKGLDRLCRGWIGILMELFRNGDEQLTRLSVDEFVFFVSALQKGSDSMLCMSECRSLITAYRCLSPLQRRYVCECAGLHNWKETTLQFFSIIGQSLYFNSQNEKLYLSRAFRG